MTVPLFARALLFTPERVLANLDRARAAGVVERPPNAWQLALGVLRLWHRVIFRGESVGRSPGGRVRPTLRARLLERKALRLPFLLWEGAVRPFDFTGLASSPDAFIRHLLGAHHDGNQFVYDLEVLAACHPGALERLHAELLALLADPEAPRHRWLRDLVVFEGYHEALRAAVERALATGPTMTPAEAADPDLSFRAYLRWCAAQPATPAETLAAILGGRFRLDGPLPAPAGPDDAAGPFTAAGVRGLGAHELADLLAAGEPLAPEALAGRRYRGVAFGLPGLVERLTWKRFAKAFACSASGEVHGWNVRVHQDDPPDAPARPLVRRGREVTFGPFAVLPHAHGVLLDYGARARFPLSLVRDPLVAVNRGSTELLLGRSDLLLAGAPVPTPSWFTLERDAPLAGACGAA